MKKKILHIIIRSSYDGAAVYPIRLCKNINNYDHSIISCFRGNAFEEILAERIKCENLIDSDNISYKYLPLKYWKFFRYIRKNSYDIIHYHQGGLGILLLAFFFRKKAKVIHHLHSGNLIGDNTKQSISILHLIILKYLSTRTHQIAVAKHVFNEYASNIKLTQNLKLVRNSQPFHFEKKMLRTNSVGYIGRFTIEKGFPFAIDISKKLNEIKPDLKFIFIGEEERTISDRYQPELSNSEFVTPTFDVQKFYKSIDLVLFLSTAPESFPLVVMEAISFDIGVIAFPIRGVVEMLGSEYPLYVKSSEDVIEKLKLYYSDKINLDNLSQIHENITNEYRFGKMLTAIKRIYSQCLNT